MLRVRLVGGLRLELDGREIDVPRSRRARSLLAWLAAHEGMHARSELAGRFWPDVLDQSARASLRAALTELRGALGSGADQLVTGRESVALAGSELWVDVRAFERLLAERELEEAIELGSGRLLAGLDDEWALAAREAHATRLVDLHEQLARRAEQSGRRADAIMHTRAAVALDPLAEDTGRRLMRRLAEAGDRAAAITVYEALAARLRADLGIAPSAATRALAEDIRRDGDAAHAPPPRGELPPPAALARVSETPFVGREHELARLRAAWRDVTTHATRRLVLVAGEPGIGKTHLMLRFGRERQADAGAVLLGRCSEEPLSAYEPFAEVLRHCAAAFGAGFLAERAGQGGQQLDRLLGQARAEPEGDAGARHRLFDAVDAALSAVAGTRPLVLMLDDLHWADRLTTLLLGALLRSARRAPMLVVATCRAGDLQGGRSPAAALAELQRDPATHWLAVPGLERGDVRTLARSWLGDEAAARVADAVHARTDGNAFFVEEMLRRLADHDIDAVPDSVRQAVAARVARLGEDAEALLAVAAVLGLEVDVGILEAVAGLPADAAEPALDELLETYLLRPSAGAADSVEFPHALVREAVEAECNPLRRRRLHQRAADVLAVLSEERHLEAIAHHLEQAAAPGEGGRVAGYLERAGARAERMLAHEEAAAFYARAIDALGARGAPDEPRIGRLQIARGEALLRAGDPNAAHACFTAAAALARRIDDAELLARAALGRSGLGISIIALDPERIALLEEALEAIGGADEMLRSQLLARLAVELYYAPTRDRSESLSAQAVAAARSSGDPRGLAAALSARHVALWRPDRLRERLATADEMVAAARAAGERHLELQARNWRVTDLFELGDMDAWRVEVARHGALADELRLPAFTWYAPLWHAVDALHRGAFAEAQALREEAREAGRRAGDANADLFAQLLMHQEAMLRMQFSAVDWALVEEKIVTSPARISWRCGYAWALAELGRADEANEILASIAADDFAALPFDANWPSAIGECAEACILLGDARVAAPLYELIAPYAGRPLTAGRAICTYGSCARHLGGLAALLGRLDDAVAHYEDAIRRDEAAGLRPWVVRSRRGLARTLAAAGDAERAGEVAARAAAEAAELGLASPAVRTS